MEFHRVAEEGASTAYAALANLQAGFADEQATLLTGSTAERLEAIQQVKAAQLAARLGELSLGMADWAVERSQLDVERAWNNFPRY